MELSFRDRKTKEVDEDVNLCVNKYGDVFELYEDENNDGDLQEFIHHRDDLEAFIDIPIGG